MDTEQDRSVVLLHDVVEHLAHELDEIKVKFRTEIRDAVDTMAERDDKAYLNEKQREFPALPKTCGFRLSQIFDLRQHRGRG